MVEEERRPRRTTICVQVIPENITAVCAAVQDGRAVGVAVVTTPRKAAWESYVRAHVEQLAFPPTPDMRLAKSLFTR